MYYCRAGHRDQCIEHGQQLTVRKSDRDLVLACSGGTSRLWGISLKTSAHGICIVVSIGTRLDDTADLAQEVFIRVYRSINNLRNPSSFSFLAHSNSHQPFYDELRKRPAFAHVLWTKRSPVTKKGFAMLLRRYHTHMQPDEKLLSNEMNDVIRKAMMRLPEQFRTSMSYEKWRVSATKR